MIQNGGRRMQALAVISAVAACALLSACTTRDDSHAVERSSATNWPSDPLLDLRANPDYAELAETKPSLHRRAVGPTSFTISQPPGDIVQQRFFVSCAPDSHVRVTIGGFYSSPCGEHFASDGSIPIETTGRPLRVTVDVPEGIRFWIVSLPISKDQAP